MSNIITADFTTSKMAGEAMTEIAYQYDYGQVLQIVGLDLPMTYEVQFASGSDTTTITSIGDENGVVIPDEVLEAGQDITAYIYLHDAVTDGETEYRILIPVEDRPAPVRSTPTPEQADVIAQAIVALNDGVSRAEDAADEAEATVSEIKNMTAVATTLTPGSAATASYADGTLTLGIPQGAKGDTGEKGDTGATPAFSIGTVETLEPEDDATATITGTAAAPVLNFGIPQGEKGEQILIDDTLSFAGQAADAKATGDAVNEVKSALSEIHGTVIYSQNGDTNIFRQGTPVSTQNTRAIVTVDAINLESVVDIVDISDDSTFRMVLYAKNGSTGLGYVTDGGYTDTITSATVYTKIETAELNQSYNWYVTVFNSTGNDLDLATSAPKVRFDKSVIYKNDQKVENIKNPYTYIADDELFRQGTATNTSNASSITTNDPISGNVEIIKTTLTNFVFALYARTKTGVGVGYLKSDYTFTDTYSQSLFSSTLDFKNVQRMFPQYNFYAVAKMSNGTSITPSSHGSFITFVESDFLELDNDLLSICPIYSKKVVCFGDSIFGMFRDTSWADESIPSMISKLTKASCYNAGMGGTRACPSGAANDTLSFSSIVTAITTGNWTAQDAFLETVIGDYAQYYFDNIAYLKTLDFSNIDIITVSYGTNDWSASVSLANYEAGLKDGINAMLTAYPNLTVVICTPIIRFLPDGAGASWEYDSDDAQAENNNGNKISDYATTCQSVGHELHLPVVDMYWSLGVNGKNKSIYFGNVSGVHPVRAGRELIARRLAAELNKM